MNVMTTTVVHVILANPQQVVYMIQLVVSRINVLVPHVIQHQVVIMTTSPVMTMTFVPQTVVIPTVVVSMNLLIVMTKTTVPMKNAIMILGVNTPKKTVMITMLALWMTVVLQPGVHMTMLTVMTKMHAHLIAAYQELDVITLISPVMTITNVQLMIVT
jgi:hypothetical protein